MSPSNEAILIYNLHIYNAVPHSLIPRPLMGLLVGQTNLLQHSCVFIFILTNVADIIFGTAAVNLVWGVSSAAGIWFLVTSTGQRWDRDQLDRTL